MLSKEQINHCKRDGNGALIQLLNAHRDDHSVLFILQNLGRLPEDFDDSWVSSLLVSRNAKLRLWSARTLGKSANIKNVKALHQSATEDESTQVRCEAVAAIGRMKNASVIPILISFLNDDDPKLVVQAIRGLFVFKKKSEVRDKLQSCAMHPNETIQKIVRKEFFAHRTVRSRGVRDEAGCAHALSSDFLKNVIVLGDVLQTLSAVPDESFHLTFTSPPYYNARDYSIYKSYQEYLHFLRQVFALTHEKTKEGRFLIVNTSPVIIPRVSRQHASKRYPIPFDVHGILVALGWEFIDDIVWVKPESSVKNRNAGFGQHRKPLAYKPNAVTEYLMVYRKKSEQLIDWNIRQYDSEAVHHSRVSDGYETSNVWHIAPTHNKVHSAVFPAELCKRVVQYYSYKGDLVFDPFAGSGTFGRVAKSLGRYFFLTEQNAEYFNYMKTFFDKQEMHENDDFATRFISCSGFQRSGKSSRLSR